jgi:hypothetical protein
MEDMGPAALALFFHNFSTFLGPPGLRLEALYVPGFAPAVGSEASSCFHVAMAMALEWVDSGVADARFLVPRVEWSRFASRQAGTRSYFRPFDTRRFDRARLCNGFTRKGGAR